MLYQILTYCNNQRAAKMLICHGTDFSCHLLCKQEEKKKRKKSRVFTGCTKKMKKKESPHPPHLTTLPYRVTPVWLFIAIRVLLEH